MSDQLPKGRDFRSRPMARQRGVVLVISLIVLVAMTLAGIALVRSTDTASVISGNFAFRQAALHAVDTGVESAFLAITQAGGYASATAATTAATTTGGIYSPILLADTSPADGVPDVDWSTITPVDVNGNAVRWVIERMCSQNIDPGAPDLIRINCSIVYGPDGESKRETGLVNPIQSTAYRITIRVTGPRNTVVTTQSVVAM